MSTELYILTLAALLQVVQYGLYSVVGNRQTGVEAGLSPRDKTIELTGAAGRLKRALDNHFEGLLMFAVAVVVVTLGEQSSTTTQACAHIYLIARVLYIPAYVQGLVPWRSVIWMAGFVATVVMLVAALI